jgi:hypothetical protein
LEGEREIYRASVIGMYKEPIHGTCIVTSERVIIRWNGDTVVQYMFADIRSVSGYHLEHDTSSKDFPAIVYMRLVNDSEIRLRADEMLAEKIQSTMVPF